MDLNFVTISLDNSYVENKFLGPSRVVVRVVTLLGPLFLFSYFFFLPFFFVFFLAFSVFIFSHFLFISSFF